MIELPKPMKCVYKYPFSMKTKRFSLLLPIGWKFLCVLVDDDKGPHLWAEVVDGATKEEVNFSVYGTGQEIPIAAEYLTTYTIGPFNFHLYRMP